MVTIDGHATWLGKVDMRQFHFSAPYITTLFCLIRVGQFCLIRVGYHLE